MVKEKLTLSVERAVVEKAKKLGINISDVTETILRGVTSATKPEGSLYVGYMRLFASIVPLLEEFDVAVVVAHDSIRDEDTQIEYPFEVRLTSDGDFRADAFEAKFRNIKQINRGAFLPPLEILQNLADQLARSEETKKQRLKEVMMAKRIIEAMREPLIGHEPKEAPSEDADNP